MAINETETPARYFALGADITDIVGSQEPRQEPAQSLPPTSVPRNLWELGKKVKSYNPQLSDLSDYDVGKAYYAQNPGTKLKHPPGEHSSFVPGPIEVLQGPIGQTINNFADGLVNGMFLTAPEQVTGAVSSLTGIKSPYEQGGLTQGAGEMVGEIVGPYRMAHNFFVSKAPILKMIEKHPQLGRVALSGVESSLIEGTKAAVRFEDPTASLAWGLTVGALPEGVVRISGKLLRRLGAKIAKPQEGELDTKTMELYEKYNIPSDPSVFRPNSGLVRHFHDRLRNTFATRDLLQKRRALTAELLKTMQQNILFAAGNNKVLMSVSQVGPFIKKEVKAAQTKLKTKAKNAYEAIAASGIGKVTIDPYMKVTRKWKDEGESVLSHETTINSGLQSIVKYIPETALDKAAMKNLRKWVKDVTKKGGKEGEIEKYKDYKWYWAQLQALGAAGEDTSVKKIPKVKRLYTIAYHLLQDAIDGQACSISPGFNEIVNQARSDWINHRTFEERPLAKDIERAKDPDKVIDIVFSNRYNVTQAKKMFGAETFNSLRQSWLKELLWDAVVDDEDTGVQFVSGRKIASKLSKYTDGVDSEYLREVFSDEGFTDVFGKDIVVDTKAKRKLEEFMDLYHLGTKVERSLLTLKGGQEQFGAGAGAERATHGVMIADIVQGGQRSRGLLSNIMFMKRAGEIYFAPVPENILLGGTELPQLGELSTRFPFSGDKREIPLSAISSTTLNKLREVTRGVR